MKNLSKNKIWAIATGCVLSVALSGCKDYLNVQPIDRLTGNNYYLSQDDVESNLAFIYARFFDKSTKLGSWGRLVKRDREEYLFPKARTIDRKGWSWKP